jgi:flagellar biosynthesis GTPase FlhF
MNEQMEVGGIAIKPGISKNGINYTKEELKKFIPTLRNRPILKDHRGEVDNTVGLVTKSFDKGGSVVGYSGWVKEDGSNLLEKINDGRVKEVSIGAFVKRLVKQNDNDDYLTAIGLEAMELSLTPIPAVRGTSLKQTLESMDAHRRDGKVKVTPVFENTNSFVFENIKNKEVPSMAEEETPKETPEEAPADAPADNQDADTGNDEGEDKEDSEDSKESLKKSVKEEVLAELKAESEAKKIAAEKAAKEEALRKEKVKEEVRKELERERMKEEMKKEILSEKTKTVKNNTKGKILTREETQAVQEEVESQVVVEKSEFGNGFSFFRQPKADGRLI